MNGKKAKLLRKLAKAEMASDPGVVDHELVIGRMRRKGKVRDELMTNPNSVQAMVNKLKTAYKKHPN